MLNKNYCSQTLASFSLLFLAACGAKVERVQLRPTSSAGRVISGSDAGILFTALATAEYPENKDGAIAILSAGSDILSCDSYGIQRVPYCSFVGTTSKNLHKHATSPDATNTLDEQIVDVLQRAKVCYFSSAGYMGAWAIRHLVCENDRPGSVTCSFEAVKQNERNEWVPCG